MMMKIKTIHFMIEINDEITPINLMVVDSSGIILKLILQLSRVSYGYLLGYLFIFKVL
jgi:hypothetical protein